MAKKTQVNIPMVAGHPSVWEDEKSLKKYYKKLDDATVEQWVADLGLEFKPNDSQPIHRMRACIAVLYHYFPRETKAKKESPYKKYDLEDLLTLALDNDVVFEMTDDEKILRMRAIMALRAAKVIE